MKKLLISASLLFLLAVTGGYAQTVVFSEDFETVDSVTATGNPAWAIDNTLQHSGVQSYHNSIATSDTSWLTTNAFSTTGNFYVLLDFWQICKIEFFDYGIIEVSNDNGATWTKVTSAQYLGSGSFGAQGNKFSAAAYPDWIPQTNSATPANSWFKNEQFDISALAQNAAQVMVRFKLYDGNATGANGNYGWVIDDIKVNASVAELIPPVITMQAPLYTGVVYSTGPFNITASITDTSGIASASVTYTVNNGTPSTVAMTNTTGSTYVGVIPAVNDNDTVCYYVTATDATANANTANKPSSGCTNFIVSKGVSLSYGSNFEVSDTNWTASFLSGSTKWEWGTPAYGVTTGAHSGTNAWDLNLATAYTLSSSCTLTSPVFDFSGAVNATLSFWQNRDLDSYGYAGTTVQYTTDNTTWQVLGTVGDPNAVNWYTYQPYTGAPVWDGTSSGWVKSEYMLSALNNVVGPVRFRFVFASLSYSYYGGDGMSIDDFSITLPIPQDAGIKDVTQPGAQASATSSNPVNVVLKNFGTLDITSADISYTIDGGTPVTQTWTGTLIPGDTVSVSLAGFTAPTGAFTLCAYTTLTGDTNSFNDTICISSFGVPTYALPYVDNFDTSTNAWTTTATAASQWELGTPAYGATTGAYSSPNSWDINLTSAYTTGANAILTSPVLDFSTAVNATLSFWQNRNLTQYYDGFNVEYTTDGGNTWNLLGYVGDPAGTNWYTYSYIYATYQPGWDGNSGGWVKSEYDLGFLNNSGPVQFRFVFDSYYYGTPADGVSIDNFAITLPIPEDIGIKSIIQPYVQAAAGNSSPAEVEVKNYGTQTLSSFDVAYTINGGTPVTQNWTGTLNPGNSIQVTLPNYTAPTGSFTFCAYTTLSGDSNNVNDTACTSINGVPSYSLPYINNFDSASTGWTADYTNSGTQWELGTPAFGSTTGAHSTPNSWDINLTSAYTTGSNATLTSPIFDFTNAVNATLSFWQNRNTYTYYDGFRLEYSTDGVTWQTLGTVADPNGTNWYTNSYIYASYDAGWDGSSNGWVKSEYLLDALNNVGLVQFRFTFDSYSYGTPSDGVSIDNFSIKLPFNDDASVISIVKPAKMAASGSNSPVEVIIKNYGLNDITSMNINYSINGGTPTTYAWTGTLSSYATATATLANFNVPSAAGPFDICVYTVLSGDGDNSNDTMCQTVMSVPLIKVPWTDDFDTSANIWTVADGFEQWVRGTPAHTVINSALTPPNAWVTNLSGQYQDASNDNLYSPFFDFSTAYNAELRFYHWIHAESGSDGGNIEYSSNGGATWQTLGYVGDPSGTNWYTDSYLGDSYSESGWSGTATTYTKSTYKLSFLNNFSTPVQFRIHFLSDSYGYYGSYDGWAIDSFQVFVPIPLTASAVSVMTVNPLLVPAPTTVKAIIQNKGTNSINKVKVTLEVDNAVIVTDSITFTPVLPMNGASAHTFSMPWQATPGIHKLRAWTSLPNGATDMYFPDDTTYTMVTVFDSSSAYPYCNDFDDSTKAVWVTLNAYTYKSGGSSWQLGAPAQTILYGAHSGTKAWTTRLSANYPDRDSSALFTPVFNVDSSSCYKLSFWHKYNTETNADGGTVESSVDGGLTWVGVGNAYDLNWYNTGYITGLNLITPGWSGTSANGNWEYAEHYIKFDAPASMMLRFRFGSDASVNKEGWLIDDFCFDKMTAACAVGLNEPGISGSALLEQNYPNPASTTTEINYMLRDKGHIILTVTNTLGEVVSSVSRDSQAQTRQTIQLNVKEWPAGVYFYSLSLNGKTVATRKMVILE